MTGEAANPAHICIIGCGRWMRRDDQVGLLIARALQRMGVPDAQIVTTESPAIDILTYLDSISLLVLIDAAKPDGNHPPGTWRRLQYSEHTFASQPGIRLDSHAMGVDAALMVAQATGRLPGTIWIYAVAAEDCNFGTVPSRVVRGAVKQIARDILRDIAAWQRHKEPVHA